MGNNHRSGCNSTIVKLVLRTKESGSTGKVKAMDTLPYKEKPLGLKKINENLYVHLCNPVPRFLFIRFTYGFKFQFMF